MSPRRSTRCVFRPRLDRLDDRCLLTLGVTAAQLATAYGLGAGSADGNGQVVAIVGAFHDPFLTSDLATFDQANGLYGTSAAQVSGFVTQVDLAGNRVNDGWAGEAALDVEAVRVMAPSARIVVVEALSDNVSDLLAAVDVARSMAGVSVVSMSWGGSEFQGETALDAHFTTPAGHIPITFLAATGDTGSGAEWPSSSPNVIAVGGTALTVDTAGDYYGEQGWSGSGGGFSGYESEPTYQLAAQTSGVRTSPDVSIDASPNTGLSAYSTTPTNGIGSWDATGGTSLSTQLWAGLIADADQARVMSGQSTLDTNTALTLLYSNPGAFHDVAWGFNGYWSTAGYDLVTGLGTPRANAVVNALDPAPATSTPAAATTTTPAIVAAVVKTTHTKAPKKKTRAKHDLPSPVDTTTTTTATATSIDTTAPEITPPVLAPTTTSLTLSSPASGTAFSTATIAPTVAPSPAVLQASGVSNALPRLSATAMAPTTPATKAKPAPSRPDDAPRPTKEDAAKAEAVAPEAAPAIPRDRDLPEEPGVPAEKDPEGGSSAALDRYGIFPDFGSASPAPIVAIEPVAAEEPAPDRATPALGAAAFALAALWRRPVGPNEARRRAASPYRKVPGGPLGLRERVRL